MPESGSARRLDIQVVCEPDEAEPPEESLYKGTEEVVELFEAAVNSQVWHPTATALARADFRIVERSWVDTPAGWLFNCEINHVAPRSFISLLAMFTQTHYSYEPIAEVRFSGKEPRTLNEDQVLMLKEDLMTVPPALPFTLNSERWDGAKGLELVFEFKERLTPDRVQQLSEALGIWDHLRLLGAFQLDFTEARELPSTGRTVQIGPQSAGHSVAYFSEDRAAMAALLSLVRWLHMRGLELTSLTVE